MKSIIVIQKGLDNRLELDKEINNSFGKFERRIILDKLKNANIAYGQLSSVEDLANILKVFL